MTGNRAFAKHGKELKYGGNHLLCFHIRGEHGKDIRYHGEHGEQPRILITAEEGSNYLPLTEGAAEITIFVQTADTGIGKRLFSCQQLGSGDQFASGTFVDGISFILPQISTPCSSSYTAPPVT